MAHSYIRQAWHLVVWRQGYRSLQTRQKIKTLEMMGPVPYFICLQCLKNDQGKLLVGNFRIVADDALEFIRYRFPNARVIWSYILTVFISAILQTYAQWENLANVLIPMYLPWFCNQGGRGAIFHPTDINPGPALFQSNGVHLSRLDSLVEAIVIFPFYHSK